MKYILTCLLGVMIFLWIQSPAFAFDILPDGIHQQITKDAFAKFEVKVDGNTFKFTDNAVNEIVDANWKTDLKESETKEAHFDSEVFPGGSERVKTLKEEVITLVTKAKDNNDLCKARQQVGRALHTVQDFYSHSNWVELGHSSPDINTKIGREKFEPSDFAAPETPTCPDDKAILRGAGLTQLTSGYYVSMAQACDLPKVGKCIHGWNSSIIGPKPCPGLNKDNYPRGGENFCKAKALAVEATKDFLSQIFDDSRMKNVEAIKNLMERCEIWPQPNPPAPYQDPC